MIIFPLFAFVFDLITALSTPRTAKLTSFPISQADLKSSYLETRYLGCSNNPTMFSVYQRSTTIPLKVPMLSPILRSSKTHTMSMSYTNTCHGDLDK